MAADDMAAALADIVEEPAVNGVIDLAGPESLPIAELVGRYLAASGDTRTVADPQARYFGASFDNRGLTPRANPHLRPTRFEAWVGGTALLGWTAGRRSRAGGVEHRETSEPSRGALRASARHANAGSAPSPTPASPWATSLLQK
jgi:uncharacterized protein YbjT (DUF2867 family)